MLFWFIILLNTSFSNDLRVANDFYQLPNYSENNYREVFAINIDNSFNYNIDYFVLKTYFQIYEPVGFDSLNDKTFGLKNRALQASQFQFDLKLNFLQLSVGRILNFEGDDLYNIDGFRSKISFKNFALSHLYGKEINNNSFLGLVDFYDDGLRASDDSYRSIIDYYIHSISVSSFYKENLLMLTYTEFKDDDYLAYQSFKANLNLEFWKIKSSFQANYLFTRDDFEQVLASIEIYDYGIEYEEYKPFFMNDSIFNIFVIDKYRRSSIYYNGLFAISFFTENFDYYGLETSVKFFKKYRASLEYLHKEHFYISLNSDFETFNISLNYYYKDELSSYATRLSYIYKLILESNISLYSDFIYNDYYKLQLKAGLLLSSYF